MGATGSCGAIQVPGTVQDQSAARIRSVTRPPLKLINEGVRKTSAPIWRELEDGTAAVPTNLADTWVVAAPNGCTIEIALRVGHELGRRLESGGSLFECVQHSGGRLRLDRRAKHQYSRREGNQP